MPGPTEAADHDLVVLVDVVETSVVRNVGSDLLAVLLQLDSDAFPDGRVGLLGLDTEFLDDDSLGVGGGPEGLLPSGGDVLLVVVLLGPSVLPSLIDQFSSCSDSSWFSDSHGL